MITQIKRWFQKLFAWLTWQDEPATTRASVQHHRNRGINAEPVPRPSFDDTIPQQNIAPQFGSQGETRCSIIEEWAEPDAIGTPSGGDTPWEQEAQLPPSSLPLLESGREGAPKQSEQAIPALPPAPAVAQPLTPPPTPTVEQRLEFLRYLVQRGLVNEGFNGDQVPTQYRKKGKK